MNTFIIYSNECLLIVQFALKMGEDREVSSISDDIKDLFDLVKEGVSYLLHMYLFLVSKSIPLEFVEKLFDSHKEKSTYDFQKDGKTFIYRFTNCIYKVEKQLVGMALQYIYNTVPLPFVKSLYENFCVNNDLECTDVKLKKCKKALKSSSKQKSSKRNAKSESDQSKDDTNDDDLAGESVAPVPKNLNASLEDQNKTSQQTEDQNQTTSQKNVGNISKPAFPVFKPLPNPFALPATTAANVFTNPTFKTPSLPAFNFNQTQSDEPAEQHED